MTIGAITLLSIGVVVFIGGIAFARYLFSEDETGAAISVLAMGVIVGIAMIVGPIVYANTETGKRALKDQQSNFGSGIERVVSVYDLEGELIKRYEGKFDIETDNENYILFDDEQGKRHIIYNTTGTVIVDEK